MTINPQIFAHLRMFIQAHLDFLFISRYTDISYMPVAAPEGGTGGTSPPKPEKICKEWGTVHA